MGWLVVVMGHPMSLKIASFDTAHPYKFLLAFCIKYMYVPILHRFLDIARCWSKISD